MKRLACYLIISLTCCIACNQHTLNPLEGTWILIAVKGDNSNSLQRINKFPAGFRFYSPDSVEVYSDYSSLYRFSSYTQSADSLIIQRQEGSPSWKSKIIQRKDSLKIFLPGDTLLYYRALRDNPTINGSKVIDRMVLAIGSSWGDFCAVVLYPNGKSLFMTKFPDSTFKEIFYIKTSKGLFNRLQNSLAVINELTKTEAYQQYRDLTEGSAMDGGFDQFLVVSGDSSMNSKAGELHSFGNHLLGTTYYGVAEVLGLPLGTSYNSIHRIKILSDSMRSPYVKFFRGSDDFKIDFAEKILLMESLNSTNRIGSDYSSLKLPYHFQLENSYSINKIKLSTDGRIVKINKDLDSAVFKLPYSLKAILKRSLTTVVP